MQFPLVRIVVAILFLGIGVLVAQTILNLLRSAFSITDLGTANILAFVLITPFTYFSYWMYVRTIEKRDLSELGFSGAPARI